MLRETTGSGQLCTIECLVFVHSKYNRKANSNQLGFSLAIPYFYMSEFFIHGLKIFKNYLEIDYSLNTAYNTVCSVYRILGGNLSSTSFVPAPEGRRIWPG